MYGKEKTRRMRWAGHGTHVREEKCLQRFVGRPEGKRPLVRHRCRWNNNIKVYVKGVEWHGVDCIYLAQNRDKWLAVVNMVMNLQVP
jgi:hypothetical protein